jgi:hypothetical protein
MTTHSLILSPPEVRAALYEALKQQIVWLRLLANAINENESVDATIEASLVLIQRDLRKVEGGGE